MSHAHKTLIDKNELKSKESLNFVGQLIQNYYTNS